RQALAALGAADPDALPAWLDGCHYPPVFDLFRVEWERAAWQHAGRPRAEARAKRTLLRWRLHTLLADLTGDLVHFYQSALARPARPGRRGPWGWALPRAARWAGAAPPRRQAVAGTPFALPAARALGAALGVAGARAGQRRFARERRLLHRAAPEAVPAEPWF